MIRLAQSIALALALVGLTACSNAIYYYQSDRVSLTLETRPDPTQPVQGNLGIKQRIAVITPGTESVQIGVENEPGIDSSEVPKGEALSLIGSFKFGKDKGSGLDTGPVVIKAALICGDAAAKLKPGEASNASKALTAQSIPTYADLALRAIQKAEEKQKKPDLTRLNSKKFSELSSQEKKELGEITGALSTYDAKLHEEIQKTLEKER
jgi:hypothetical protein